MFGFRRIDRYVLRELIGPTVLAFSMWTFIVLMNAFFLLAQKAVAKNLGWELTYRLFALELPELLVLTIPMGVLMGSLLGVGRLSADSEWIALQAAGHGPWVLLKPLILLGLIATLITGYIYWEVSPGSRYAKREARAEVFLASNMASDLRPRTFYSQLHNVVLFVDEIRPGDIEGRLEGVFIHRVLPESGDEELILARTGGLKPSPDRSGNLEIDLWDGIQHHFSNDSPDRYQAATFDSMHDIIPASAFLKAFQEPPNKGVLDMGFRELRQEMRDAREETDPVIGPIRRRYAAIEFQMRIALPATCLLFAVLALPLGVTRARSGKGAGIAMSVGVFLVYYIVFRVFRDQAHAGDIPVWLGVWSGNLALLPFALFGLWRFRRPGDPDRGLIPLVRGFFSKQWHRLRRWSPARKEEDALTEAERESGAGTPVRHGGASSRLISRLDMYVAGQYIRVFLTALLSCYALYIIIEFRALVGEAIKNEVPIGIFLDYFKYFAPGMIPFVLPVSCLVGGIVSVTLLTRNGELTAIKASGISARRSTFPIVFITILLCGVYFVVQDRIMPVTNVKKQEVRDRILNRAPRTYGSSGGRWVFGGDNERLYHYRMYDYKDAAFRDLTVLRIDRDNLRVLDHRFARTARWNGESWDLEDGWYRSFPVAGAERAYERHEDDIVTLTLAPPEHFVERTEALDLGENLAQQMSIRELREEIRSLQASGYDTTRLQVSYFAKYAQPLSPLVMLLIGMPFAFRMGRKGSLYGIGIAILLVIVYWTTFATFNALGLETILPPFLAAWAPNVLYGLLGTYLLLFVPT